GPLTEQQRHSVGRVRHAIGNALGLIDELIEIAKSDTGQLEVERAPVRLQDIAREMLEEYRPQAVARGLALDCSVQDALPVVYSDEVRIRQILGNLLSNAVKYTRTGTISLSAGVRTGSAPGTAVEWAALDVTDTGP